MSLEKLAHENLDPWQISHNSWHFSILWGRVLPSYVYFFNSHKPMLHFYANSPASPLEPCALFGGTLVPVWKTPGLFMWVSSLSLPSVKSGSWVTYMGWTSGAATAWQNGRVEPLKCGLMTQWKFINEGPDIPNERKNKSKEWEEEEEAKGRSLPDVLPSMSCWLHLLHICIHSSAPACCCLSKSCFFCLL